VSTDNTFLALADRQICSPRQARLRASEKRAARQADEREKLNAIWRQWQDERRAQLLAGPYGDAFQKLIAFLDNMNLHDGAALVDLVKVESWHEAASDTRFGALRLIDSAIIALRERNGLPPFDDPIEDDQPSVFIRIREVLR
jgi:hypothetical protein